MLKHINKNLPSDITLHSITPVTGGFDAKGGRVLVKEANGLNGGTAGGMEPRGGLHEIGPQQFRPSRPGVWQTRPSHRNSVRFDRLLE